MVNGVLLAVLSHAVRAGLQRAGRAVTVPGIGDIQAIEDFIVSNNILPLGRPAAACCSARAKAAGAGKASWREADTGSGLKFPRWARGYVTYVIPVGMLIVFAMGYAPIIAKWAGLG